MPRQSLRLRVTGAIALAGVLAASGVIGHQAIAQSRDSTQQRLDRLEAGLVAVESIRAVKRLQHTYAHYLEAGLWSGIGDLFTDGAAAQFPSGAVTGKANIRRHVMEQAGRRAEGLAEGQLNAHLVMQPIVTLGADGTTAKGTWHEIALLGQFGKSASWRGGVYENEYVLEQGAWKISRLQYYEQYQGAYDEYGHTAPPKWGIPYHFDSRHVGLTIPASVFSQPQRSSARDALSRLAVYDQLLRRLDDETQVQNLQHSYGYYMDRKLWDDVADLFDAAGTFEVAGRGVYVGRPRIRQALEALYGGPRLRTGEMFDQINLGTVVTVADDRQSARARTSQLSMIGLNGDQARWEYGIYENEFVKDERAGVWAIKAIRYFPRLVTDYDAGWARDAKANAVPSKDFPPDRPSSQPYASYPGVHHVGFHFVHPVTGDEVKFPAGPLARVSIVKNARGVSLQPGKWVFPGVSYHGDRAAHEVSRADAAERLLDRAIGVDAVENLMSSYGYYIDESAWDQMADTFSVTHGAKEITGAGTYVGQDRIRTVLNLRGPQGGRTANFFTIHQLTQPVIHVSDDGTSAKARLRLFQCGGNADGSSGSWISGVYENTAVKENGEWKFGVQDLHHILNASYRNGWARVGAAGRGNPNPNALPAERGRGAGAAAPAGVPAATGARAAGPPAGGQDAGAGARAGRGGREVPGGGITQGLGGARQPAQFAKEFPPDRPIRARQYAFPEVVEPAFHYRNPVTGRMPAELLP